MSRSSRRKLRRARMGRWVNALGLVAVLAVAAAALYSHFNPQAREQRLAARRATQAANPRTAGTAAGAATGTAAGTPRPLPDRRGQPWEYDPTTDSHFDPRPGHEHWHQGPPPSVDERLRLTAQQ